MSKFISFWMLWLIACFASAAEVISFHPTGSVKNVQQITVKFSSDMIAFGDPRSSTDPFSMNCEMPKAKKQPAMPKHTSRWMDTKSWLLEFDTPLPAGIRCLFSLKQDLKDLNKVKVQALNEYALSTSGPLVKEVRPRYGDIEPDQYFVVSVDGAIDLNSLVAAAYFEVEGVPDKVQVKVIKGEERKNILKVVIKNDWSLESYQPYLNQAAAKQLDDFIVIAATRRFPDNSKVVLHWPKGIKSASGMEVENPQKFDFSVIEAFKAKFSCDRVSAERPCNPILDMYLNFSKEVSFDLLKDAKLVGSNGKTWLPQEFKNKVQVLSNISFKGPFPEASSFKLILPANIKDELGRPLSNQDKFPLEVKTDTYSPLIKFPANFGVFELKANPALPVSIRNVEKDLSIKQLSIEGKSLNITNVVNKLNIINWYRKVIRREYDYENRNQTVFTEGQGDKIVLPKADQGSEFKMVGIPLKKSGLYVVEMESPILGKALVEKGSMFVSTAALVTDMAVHFKKGRDSSLVWVTELSSAKPVADANVSIVDAAGKELFKGKTNKEGILKAPKLAYPCTIDATESETYNENYDTCEIFVFAQKGEDFSFVSSSWSKGIETYRFNVSMEYLSKQWGPFVAHTILDRMAALQGEVVNMKHVVREYRQAGIQMMDAKRLPKRVLIVHQGSMKTYSLPFEYDKTTGSAISSFKIPKDATLGRYSVYLSNTESKENQDFDWSSQETGHFIVSDYRTPLMEAMIKLNGGPLIQPKEVLVDLYANYLSGGAAKDLKIKLRSSLNPDTFVPHFAGSNEYNFFSDPLQVGIINSESRQRKEEKFFKVEDLKLNGEGALQAKIGNLPSINKLHQLAIEMEYLDPNGEVKTKSAYFTLFPSKNIIGLRSDQWFGRADKTKVMGVITDTTGKMQADRAYTVEAYRIVYHTHRKRLVGGFYSYDSTTETVKIGNVCEGKSDQQGRFECTPKSLPPGEITLQAKTLDDTKSATYASVHLNIFEPGQESWWVPSDSDRIDLLPEKNQFEPGETAKLMVRSPFQKSTVLVTVEREGILDSFVKEVLRENPVIEVPIRDHYSPNIFISVLAVRGRLNEGKPTFHLDLARPAMKMGISEVKVGWKAHRLAVEVLSDKKKYKTREKAEITVQVKAANGQKLSAPSEVAIIAVDEALLQLKENTSVDLLQKMMGARSLAVTTSSGQNQVVGKRHFGMKANALGGGGGISASSDTRELFDMILLFEPRLKLDAQGQAKIKIPLNDSITSFRIFAVATSGVGLFGHGSTKIESSKDLIIYSGFSKTVREGDLIKNRFTLRNTSTQLMKVDLKVSAKEIASLPNITPIELKAGESSFRDIEVKVPIGLKEINFQIKAVDSVSGSQDAMLSKVRVEEALPERILQADLEQIDKPLKIPVKRPIDATPGKGGILIQAKPSLIASPSALKTYMEQYSYSCFEQKISKAIILEKNDDVKQLIDAMPTYLDELGLIKFFPTSICGTTQLTRYVMNILAENNYEIPQTTKEKVLAGLLAVVQGKSACQSWWDQVMHNRFLTQSKILIMETLSRYQSFSKNLLTTVPIDPNQWKSETIIAWIKLLQREKDIANRDQLIKHAENVLRTRINFQGSMINSQEQLNWEDQWMLFTSKDQQFLGILSIALGESSLSEDAGKIARGVVAKMRFGRWDTTMANTWGLTYLKQFSAKYEKENVLGETKINMNQEKYSVYWETTPDGDSKKVSWGDGSDSSLQISHTGSGKPWVLIQASAAIPLKAPLDMGYKISRKITPVYQAKAGKWQIGDVANVELTIIAKTERPWVVVKDPIPAGSSHLGTGLEGSSKMLDISKPNKNEVQDLPIEYAEKSLSHYIAYAAYLPQGTYRVSYRIRLNSAGEFKLPPSRVEAMYSPETFGEVPNEDWKVTN